MRRSGEINKSRWTDSLPPPAALVLIVSTCLISWLAMMVVHESGHVLAAWLSGGTVVKVVLHPLSISRTDVVPNPHPLLVVWGGPVWGVLVPLTAYGIGWVSRSSATYLLAFFAGFCLIANGAYIGAGFWYPVGDALELHKLGAPPLYLASFGLSTMIAGMWIWHGLGKHFGIGTNRLPVRWRTAVAMTAATALVAAIEWLLSDRV